MGSKGCSQHLETTTMAATTTVAATTTTTTTMNTEPCTDPQCRTEHGCVCLKVWESQGKTKEGCDLGDDTGSGGSCFVVEPQKCTGAVQDSEKPEMKRDRCGLPETTTPMPS